MTDVSAASAATNRGFSANRPAIDLFLVGFLILFLELSWIRWLAAYIVFLQFFTNVVLIASFLGMSCGCLASRRRLNWFEYYPAIAVSTVFVAIATFLIYHFWSGIAFDVGGQRSPQEVFFGTDSRDPDVARFVVPIEAIAGFFFVLIALMFVGLGQVMGRAFDACSDRVRGYTANIAGSLAGIVAFSALSFLQLPPGVWFLVSGAGIAYMLHRIGALTRARGLALAALVLGVGVQGESLARGAAEVRWSPYYKVAHEIKNGGISVDTVAHQKMVPFSATGSLYSLIYLLQQQSGGAPFHDVLVIGAGSGNDVAHALKFGVERVDAVEIDPVIQDIGRRYHPDRPYQDKRVVPHLDDGRHFLRTTERKYDLVVYALVDSLVLHSSYANLRLESYLFTKEAFENIRRVLKPNGVFVTYNIFRQGWIVERIAATAAQTFGCRPLVMALPYRETLSASSAVGMTMVIAGCHTPIPEAFAKHGTFWLNTVPPNNLSVDGFAVHREQLPAAEASTFARVSPTTIGYPQDLLIPTDDWPFLYLHGRLIPGFTIRSMIILGLVGLAMVYLFLPSGRMVLDNRMFFLGAAFMLLETRAVTQMALLFGSTWVVNSAVFAVILVLILLANLYVLRARNIDLRWHYGWLLVFLAIGALVPPDVFLSGALWWRYLAPCALALSPAFFAGVIFARSFANAEHPEFAFGSNIAGAVLGGLAEAFSGVLGFQHLLLMAALLYLLSAWSPVARPAVAVRG